MIFPSLTDNVEEAYWKNVRIIYFKNMLPNAD